MTQPMLELLHAYTYNKVNEIGIDLYKYKDTVFWRNYWIHQIQVLVHYIA